MCAHTNNESIHTCTSTLNTHWDTQARIYARMHIRTCSHAHSTHAHTHMFTRPHRYIHIHTFTRTYLYTRTYTHKDTHTHRQTHTCTQTNTRYGRKEKLDQSEVEKEVWSVTIRWRLFCFFVFFFHTTTAICQQRVCVLACSTRSAIHQKLYHWRASKGDNGVLWQRNNRVLVLEGRRMMQDPSPPPPWTRNPTACNSSAFNVTFGPQVRQAQIILSVWDCRPGVASLFT